MQNFDYKNQLLDICNSFNTSIEDYVNMINETSIAAINNMKNSKNSSLEELNAYKEHVAKNDSYKAELVSSLNKRIESLKEKIEKDIAEYELAHDFSKEQKKIFDNRDRTLRLKKANIEKQKEELEGKITSLEKECFDLIKEKEEFIEKLDKEHKTKNIDLDKRVKFEINSINDKILTPPFSIDDNQEDNKKAFNNKVAKIRKDGINEIANKQKKYFETKMNHDIEHFSIKEKTKGDITSLKAKYDLEVLALKKKIIELDNKLKDEEYFANYNSLLLIYETSAKDGLAINEMKLRAINDVYNIRKEINVKNPDFAKQREEIINIIKRSDIKMIDEYFNHLEVVYANFKSRSLEVKKFVYSYLDNLLNIITNLTTMFINDINTSFSESMKLLLARSYQDEYLGNFNYDDSNKRIDKILLSYKKEANNRLIKFNDLLKKELQTIISQFDLYFGLLSSFVDEEKIALNNHKKDILEVILTQARNGKDESNRLDLIDTSALEKSIANDTTEYNSNIETVEKDNQDIKTLFDNKNKKLKNEKQEYLNVYASERNKRSLKLKEEEHSLLEIIKNVKRKQDKVISNKKKEIIEEYKGYIKKVDADKKTKLEMCKESK